MKTDTKNFVTLNSRKELERGYKVLKELHPTYGIISNNPMNGRIES